MAEVMPSDELVEEVSDHGALAPGSRLGRYELLVPIAKGGMARVWAARLHGQRGFTKLVAIKTILPHLAKEAEFEKMFLDEARIAAGVHHPNVCEIYELGEEGAVLYLAMEWISGDSFARVLRATGKTEPVDVRLACRVVADAAAGLHAAHELCDDHGRPLGVVHRDVSPHNILLSADGNVKVADFGVAKALGQLHEQTSAGQLKGKINYMAPEQITGAATDRRSDVFALGCVLYEATTGVKPFKGDGEHQVMHNVLSGNYPRPSTLMPGFPPELEAILAKALSLQPQDRFPTAERMRHALEEYLARSGAIVTQSNVAQIVRMRLGHVVDRRKERIRLASVNTERETRDRGWVDAPGGVTPSGRPGAGSRSGVKQAGTVQASDTPPPPGMSGSPPRPPPPMLSTLPMGVVSPLLGNPSLQAAAQSMRSPTAPPGVLGADASRSGVGPPVAMGWPVAGGAPTGAGEAAPASQGMSGPTYYVLATLIGLVIAGALGGGGFFAWRYQRAKAAAAEIEAMPIPAPVNVTAAGPTNAGPRPAQSGVAAGVTPPASASAAVVELAEITLKTTPEAAILVIDGKEQPAGLKSFFRPEKGQTVTVIVRAAGFEDETLKVTSDAPPPTEIALKPKKKVGGGPAQGGAALPDNPY